MAPLLLVDEPGPLELIPWQRFPTSHGNRRVFESLAAPVSKELERHASEIGSAAGEMMQAAAPTIDGDFARTIPGAAVTIGGLLSSEADVDPGRMLAAALEAAGEADGVSREASSEASAGHGLPGLGPGRFDPVQWQVAGATSAPPSSSPSPRGPDELEPPPSDEGAPPPSDQPPAPPSDEPAPPPPFDEPAPIDVPEDNEPPMV